MLNNFAARPNLSLTRSGGTEINSLTAIRGVAAWWVVFYHFDSYLQPYVPSPIYYLISKGYLAVDLFFCLSGFVIFLNYGSLNLQNKREIFRFYLKRLAKIYPLHIFVLGLYGLLVFALALTHRDPSGRFSETSLLLNFLLIQDWAVLPGLTWNIPSWSISAEFASYLLFPAVVLLVRFTAARAWHQLLTIGALLALLNLFYSSVHYHIGAGIETLGVPRAATQFAMGAILARTYLTTPSAPRLSQLGLYALSALFFITGLNVLESVMIPLAWTALIFAIAQGDNGSGYLNGRWLVYVGHISYATYMIHYFVRDIFKLILVHAGEVTPLYSVSAALLIVLATSVPLYHFIERPSQKFLTKKVMQQLSSRLQ